MQLEHHVHHHVLQDHLHVLEQLRYPQPLLQNRYRQVALRREVYVHLLLPLAIRNTQVQHLRNAELQIEILLELQVHLNLLDRLCPLIESPSPNHLLHRRKYLSRNRLDVLDRLILLEMLIGIIILHLRLIVAPLILEYFIFPILFSPQIFRLGIQPGFLNLVDFRFDHFVYRIISFLGEALLTAISEFLLEVNAPLVVEEV
jgi:hypothetical protein